MLCISYYQKGIVYYELLKSDETIIAHRYHQQLTKFHLALCEQRPDYQQSHDKLIFFQDYVPSHMSTMAWNYLDTLNWEVLIHQTWFLPTTTCFRRYVDIGWIVFLSCAQTNRILRWISNFSCGITCEWTNVHYR